MTSLADWNAVKQEAWDAKLLKARHPELFPNGIECPQDGGRLYDTHHVHPGPPDRIKVKCQTCSFIGWRLD